MQRIEGTQHFCTTSCPPDYRPMQISSALSLGATLVRPIAGLKDYSLVRKKRVFDLEEDTLAVDPDVWKVVKAKLTPNKGAKVYALFQFNSRQNGLKVLYANNPYELNVTVRLAAAKWHLGCNHFEKQFRFSIWFSRGKVTNNQSIGVLLRQQIPQAYK